ncbi:unnamed protein product [Caenorhabditis bovis]|uniref:Uncharacterized protein n=1 Tax=Caenorhabditis bovis TaxID=2654633 RepID=A0A8S1EB34_9PELO|nr:unnamed protein product [Caenorhabditis bovis]
MVRHRILIFFSVLCIYLEIAAADFYRGELEPRYSRRTPYRQQSDIPEPVFGIGHGERRYPDSKESPHRAPFFVGFTRRGHERSSTSREDGRNSMENGDDEDFYGRRRDRYGPSKPRRFDEDFEKRPEFQRPDSEEIRERFDRERGRDKKEEERPKESEEPAIKRKSYKKEEPEEEPAYKKEEDEEEEEDRSNQSKPSKIVGLNMQMLGGLFPRDSRKPEVEDVEDRGKFFRGSRHEKPKDESQEEKPRRRQEESAEDHHRREPEQKTENWESEHEQQQPSQHQQQQQQQQPAPPPPKPQIPPFPPFPKFPSFGGFQPFQPDFPTRQLSGDGGPSSGPWYEPSRSSRRPPASREGSSIDEERSGEDRRRHHESHHDDATYTTTHHHQYPYHATTLATPSDDSRTSHGDERDNQRSNHGEGSEAVEKSKKEFPTPGRFVTSIRAKKSEEITSEVPQTTIAPSTTVITTTTTTTTTAPGSIILPAENIATQGPYFKGIKPFERIKVAK